MQPENKPSSNAGLKVAGITGLMIAIYIFFQMLPDFAPERPSAFIERATGNPRPDLCDVSNFGFTEVSQGRSPLVMRIVAERDPQPGQPVQVVAALSTPAGRPVPIEQLRETHTEKFHLLIIDPTLEDYHHVHPQATRVPGEYVFEFSPRNGGTYRLFADLLPDATGRPVQAVADLLVAGDVPVDRTAFAKQMTVGGYEFTLTPPSEGIRARAAGIISLSIRHSGAERAVKLEPVMGAFSHMVAFDANRTGFAHMHPLQEGLEVQLDETEPELSFVFYAPQAGSYVVWAQVKINGRELFAPFRLEVL